MTSAAAREWLDLLPAEPEDLRLWLGERGAYELHKRGVRDLDDPANWPVVAEVLALVRGTVAEVINGEPVA